MHLICIFNESTQCLGLVAPEMFDIHKYRRLALFTTCFKARSIKFINED